MSLRNVASVVGLLQVFVALAMLVAAGVALGYGDGGFPGIALAALVTLVVGGGVYALTRMPEELNAREGFVAVALAWAATSVFGGLPYLFTGVLDSPAAAVFEAMSGFTTTGASVFGDVEALPHGILFWRSLTHWLGGMGIIVLAIAILPYLGVGGMQLFRAEVPGPTTERLQPRITQTAKLLWLVYVGLTVAHTLLLALGGMGVFDAVNLAFATVSTGGFSTRSTSYIGYSPYLQWVTALFMYLGGLNFALHYRAATGRPSAYARDPEWRFFTALVLLTAAAIVVLRQFDGELHTLEADARHALFQVVSIVTTTGFVSEDYELWAPGAQLVLFALFFVGGMAGSTSGGIKSIRVLLLLKETTNELRRHLHPRAILIARVGRQPVKQEVLANVVAFVILYLLICLLGAIVLAMLGSDLITSLTASMTTLGNVGPGFGRVGGVDNFGWMSGSELTVCTFLMLAGRLEIYTVLLLFHPETWKARRSFH
ncbi:MAG TPA: TrkH family potassium uptake protein [Longimicrobiales bacterium]|nr:TrkH family potassium uptake protein [Longimicrobiales bacterium]